MRQRRREVADDITYNKAREITFDDVVKFVESRARVLNHPMFARLTLTSDSKNKHKETPGSKYRQIFVIDGRSDQQETNQRVQNQREVKTFKCPLCSCNHILAQCSDFLKESLDERKKIVRKRGLCDNCLLAGHVARFCPKNSFCKVDGCDRKHSTYLHPKSVPRFVDKSAGPDNSSNDEALLNSSSSTNGSVARVNAASDGPNSSGVGYLVKVKCSGTT